MLQIKQVSKAYGTKKALSKVDLTLDRGEIVGLFGENGAGKTTLMKCILGFLRYEGEITLDGRPISRENIARVSFATSEHSFFPNLSPASHRDFYKMHFPRWREKRFSGLMDFFQLPMHKSAKHLSTGQKNQLEVILALCQGADYILMDEPFAGNDVFNREDFYKLLLGILEPGETVFLSTHLLEEVERFISRAVLLHKGGIAGDISMMELENQGRGLMEAVREIFGYKRDRVSRALSEILDEREGAE